MPQKLGYAPFRQDFELAHRSSFRGHLLALFPALRSFAVERLRRRGRAPHRTQKQNVHLKVAAVVGHAQLNPRHVLRAPPWPVARWTKFCQVRRLVSPRDAS